MNRKIYDLEKIAQEILEFKRSEEDKRSKKPLVIEFCGIPKSGKTTTINALNIFLKRNGFRTKILTERASVCPISKKTHPNFNLWTITRTISELIENIFEYGDSIDIIIADRAIFDSLVWFEWLHSNPSKRTPHLDEASYKAIISFLTTEYITKNIDLIFAFNVTPEIALEREYAGLLTKKQGSIMNEFVLKGYVEAQKKVMSKYRSNFNEIISVTEDNKNKYDPSEKNLYITELVLEKLRDIVEEKVLYFNGLSGLDEGVSDFSSLKSNELEIMFDVRTRVENQNMIHPIPVAIITNKNRDRVLMLKKTDESVSRYSAEKNKLLLYTGGHVRREDSFSKSITIPLDECMHVMRRALSREIYEELNESITVYNEEPFLIYSTIKESSKKHLAVCFVVEIEDIENKKFQPKSYEHIKKSGTSKSGRVTSIDSLVSNYDELEDWSKYILQHVFGVKYMSDNEKELPLIDLLENCP